MPIRMVCAAVAALWALHILLCPPCALAARRAQLRFVHLPTPPLNVGTFGDEARGVAPDICREVLGRLAQPYTYTLLPPDLLLQQLRSGEADGICVLRKSNDRETLLLFSEPLYTSREYVYFNPVRTPDFTWSSLAKGACLVVGLVENFTYDGALLEALAASQARLVRFASTAVLLRSLAAGTVDAAITVKTLAEGILSREPSLLPLVRAWPEPVACSETYIAISRQSPAVELLPQINAAIRELQHNGTMREILQQLPAYLPQ